MQREEQVSLADHTTLHIGGHARYFCTVTTREELREALQWARAQGERWCVIGEGSNILFEDTGFPGLIIKNAINGITHTASPAGITLTVGAGVLLDDLVAYTTHEGWWGLENLSGIPGTVGATPVQNVGAYGVEIGDLITEVAIYDSANDVFGTLTKESCGFAYRHSIFKEPAGAHLVVVGVSLCLPHAAGPQITYRDLAVATKDTDSDALTPAEVRNHVIHIRAGKFPDWHVVGTAGSFFKNPIVPRDVYERMVRTYPDIPAHAEADGRMKLSLGWILDHVCHLRGVRDGAVGLYEKQALVLVNYGNATAHEVRTFAQKVSACVQEKIQIAIEWEVTDKK